MSYARVNVNYFTTKISLVNTIFYGYKVVLQKRESGEPYVFKERQGAVHCSQLQDEENPGIDLTGLISSVLDCL